MGYTKNDPIIFGSLYRWSIDNTSGGFNIAQWGVADYRFHINTWGAVGLGIKPIQGNLTNVKLWVNGGILAPNFYVPSDSVLKDSIVGLDSSLKEIIKLKPIRYKYKSNIIIGDTIVSDTGRTFTDSNTIDDKTVHFGFTAQNLEPIFPNLVVNLGNTKGINYFELIPVMIKAMQEQQKQIEDLKAQIILIKNLTPTTTTKSVLYQNDPNPFGVHTTFTYYIDESITINTATIEIRDLNGVIKATINLSDQSGLGQIAYDGTNLAIGYFVYTLKVNGTNKDSKMLLIER